MIQVLLTWLMRPLLMLAARRRVDTPARVLVIQAAKIGDAICASPMLRELRAGLPDAHITLVCNPVVEPLLRNNPRLDEILPVAAADCRGWLAKWRMARRLRRARFDVVLCCNGGALWPVVTLWAGIPVRIGILPNFAGRTQLRANRLWTAGVAHQGNRLIVDTYFAMLRAIGLQPADSRKEVFAAPGAEQRIAALLPSGMPKIALAVSAANKLKELAVDTLADVILGLQARYDNAVVVLLGTAGDSARATQLLAALPPARRPAVLDTCGLVALADLPALMAQLDAFIGVDSGLTYMADALNLPLVSVAGPCNMLETRPVGPQAVIIQRRPPCLPCAHIFRAPNHCHVGTLACIRDIGGREIAMALVGALDRKRQ